MASICDGTTRQGTRNCEARGRWIVREAGSGGNFWAACDRHLAQVGRSLLGGEQGGLEVHSTYTDER